MILLLLSYVYKYAKRKEERKRTEEWIEID